MNKTLMLAALAIVVAGGLYVALRPDTSAPDEQTNLAADPAEGDPIVAVTVPGTLTSDAQMGETAFNAVCADCHGENAQGKMGFGPPLVHKIYEPSHHADMAFQMAVQNGVRAHHWQFGNMPPQEGLTGADVQAITAYVRELQRSNGID
ncbi:MAG: cytochrome c [Pseudomonadota bacterium]|nr:cytochrome c [Pseudomonadota bacterium]